MAKQLNIDLNVRANTDQAKRAMMELQQSLTKVAGSFASSGGKGMDTQLKAAAQAAQQLSHHLSVAYNADTGKINLNKFSASLKSANTDLKTLSSSLLTTGANGQQAFVQLAQNIAAAERPVVSLNSKLTSLWTVLKNTARWQISSTILHGFMGTIQQAYGYAQDLNKSLTNIGIVTGYNTDRMAAFAVEANKAAKSLSTTTNEYAKGSLIYFQQGLGDADVKARTDATVKMANVTGQSMEQTSNQLTAIWNNFAKGSTELESFADKITALGAATASSSAEISEGLNQFAAVANTVGLSYDYATAALATVVATTRQSANVIGTAFKTLFARIEGLKLGETLEDGTDLNKYSEALMAVGVNIKETNGEMKDMDRILDEIGAKWDTLAKDQQIALAQAVAGVRQYTQFIALMDHWDFMQDNLETVANATGTLQKQQERYAESWEAANKRLRASTEAIFTDLIDDKFFIKLTNGFAQVLDGVHDFIEGIGGAKTLFIGLGSIILSTVAQKIEPALRNVANNIKTMFQTPQQQVAQQQNLFNQMRDSARQATGINPETFSNADKVAFNNAEKLSNAKNQLTLVSKQLNDQEKINYENQVRLIEAQAQNINKIQQEIEKRKDLLAIKIDEINTHQNMADLNTLRQTELQALNYLYQEEYQHLTQLTSEENRHQEEISESQNLLAQYRQRIQEHNQETTFLISTQESLNNSFITTYQELVELMAAGKQGSVSLNLRPILDETLKSLQNFQEGINNTSGTRDRLKVQFEAIQKTLGSLGLDTLPQVKEKLQAVLNLLNKPTRTPWTAETKAQITQLIADLSILQEDFPATEQGLQRLRKRLEEFGLDVQTIDKLLQPIILKTREAARAQLEYDNAIKGFNPQHLIGGLEIIGHMAASAGSLAMILSSIKSLWTTLINPDATGWEKFSSVLMGISMIVPSVITGFNSFKTALLGAEAAAIKKVIADNNLNISQEMINTARQKAFMIDQTLLNADKKLIEQRTKEIILKDYEIGLQNLVNQGIMSETARIEALTKAKQRLNEATLEDIILEEADTEAKNKNSMATMIQTIKNSQLVASLNKVALALGITLGELLLVVGAIVAIGLAIYRMYQLWKMNTPEERAKNLAEATEQAEEAANNANQKYKDLLSTIDNYDSAIDKIKDLTKGTQEYTEAVEEANAEARKLIDTYNLTRDQFTYDNNGIIRFNAGVLDNVAMQQLSNQREARAGLYGIRNASLLNDNILAEKALRQTAVNYGLSPEKIVQLTNEAQKQGWDAFFNSAVAKQNVAQSLFGKNLDELNSWQRSQVEATIKNEEALRTNSDRIADNTAAITENNKLTVDEVLSQDNRYQGLSKTEQGVISDYVYGKYNASQEAYYNAFLSENRRDLGNQYAHELGYDQNPDYSVEIKDDFLIFKYDGKETKVHYKDAAASMAARMAVQQVVNTVGDEASWYKQAETSINKLAYTKNIDKDSAARLFNYQETGNSDKLTFKDITALEQFERTDAYENRKQALTEGLNWRNIGQQFWTEEEKRNYKTYQARQRSFNSDLSTEDLKSVNQYGISESEQSRLLTNANQYANTSEEIKNYAQATKDLKIAVDATNGSIDENIQKNYDNAKAALEAATAMGEQARQLGIDEDIYEDMIKANAHYQEGNEESIQLAEKETQANIKRRKALDEIYKISDKVDNALSKMNGNLSELTTDEDNEAYVAIKQNLGDILGIEQDLVDIQKIVADPKLFNLMKEALHGSGDAAEKLAQELWEAAVNGLQAGEAAKQIQEAMLDGAAGTMEEALNDNMNLLQQYYDEAADKALALQDLMKIGFTFDEVGSYATEEEAYAKAKEIGQGAMVVAGEAMAENAPEAHTEGLAGADINNVVSQVTGFEFTTGGMVNWINFPMGIAGAMAEGAMPTMEPVPYPSVIAKPTKPVDVESEMANPQAAYRVVVPKYSKPGGLSLKKYQKAGKSGGKSGGKGGGGGGSGGKTQTRSATITKPTVRRYSVVQNTVDSINKQLDILGKNKDRVWGKSQIDIMDQEIDRLGKLKEGYEDFAKEISGINWDKLYAKMRNGEGLTREDIENAGGYLSQDFQALFTGTKYQWTEKFENSDEQIKDKVLGNIEDVLGPLMIGANGAIANTDALKDANDARLAAAQAAFNASAQSDADKNEFERAKAEHDMWEQVIDQYQETANKNQDNFQEWLESIYAKQDKIIEQIDTKLKNGIDISERTLKRLEYTGKILGDSVYKSAELMKTWWSNGQGRDSWTEAQREWGYTQEAYNSLQQRLAEGAFDGNYSGYLNELRELQSQGYNIIDQLLELDEKNRTYYSEVIEKANEEMTKLTDEIAHNSSVLEHMQNVLSLLGRSMDYEAIGTLLKGQRDIAKSQMDVSTAQYQSAKAAFDRVEAEYKANVAGWSEDQIRYFEESMLEPARRRLNEAYDRMYEDTEAFLEKVRAVFDNTLNQIMKESEDAFTNGLGWDYVNDSMALANSIQDEYLTKTNQIYETNDLMRKLARDIDKTESTAAKTKLKNFSDEIAAMQQQEKLTQTDLEIAKARYELLQAEMALEDAKNAKSIVRLQRDNEGNYGYVYTADQGAIDEAEDNWANKQNDLYNLVLGKTNEYNQKIIQATKERDEALRKLTEEYADKDIEHNEEYQQKKQQILDYYSQIIYADQESLNSALFWLGETAATDTNEAWSQSFSDIVDKCLDYEDVVMTTNENLDNNMQQLNDSREEISSEVKTDLSDIKKKTDDLTTSSDEYAKKIQNEVLPKLDKEISAVEASTLAYINKRQAVIDLMNSIMDLNNVINNTLDEQAGLYTGDLSKLYAEAIVAGEYEKAESILAQRDDTNTNIKNDMLRKGGAIAKNGGIAGQQALKGFNQVAQGSYYQDLDYLVKKALGMATGGYTGEWSGNDGKLALLHQKELVLNAEDTKNILSSVSMIRQIADMIDLRAAAQNLTSGLLAPLFQSSASSEMNQNVTITAEFPNATNRGEIEAAFDNLINRASQFAGRWGN